jgi:glutaminase
MIQESLEAISHEIRPLLGRGSVASYIPTLAIADPTRFGMAVATVDGKLYTTGEANHPFSIQSISKVYALTLAFGLLDEALWQRVERENAGHPFNSLVQLEYKQGLPRNPLTNAGAIITTDVILSALGGTEPKEHFIDFLRARSGNRRVVFDEEIAQMEIEHGHRTKALAHFIASYKNLENSPQTVSTLYFYQCAMAASCTDLARSMLYLACEGYCPVSKKPIVTPSQAKRINALMLTCGHYDASGDFAFRVGLPGKSGISGGIVAVVPGQMVIAVYSPPLSKEGFSLAGAEALERFSTKTGLSIF